MRLWRQPELGGHIPSGGVINENTSEAESKSTMYCAKEMSCKVNGTGSQAHLIPVAVCLRYILYDLFQSDSVQQDKMFCTYPNGSKLLQPTRLTAEC